MNIIYSLFLLLAVSIQANAFQNDTIIEPQENQKDSIIDSPQIERDNLPWFEFRWLESENYFNFETEKAHMIVDVRFDRLHEPYPLYFRLLGQENLIYNRTKQSMIWHLPVFEKKMRVTQAAGRTVTESFPAIGINFGEDRVNFGNVDFIVIPDPVKPVNIDGDAIAGTLGAKIFKDKVLFIDFPGQKMAFANQVPGIYNKEEYFVDFAFNMGYITIPVVINERKYWFWLSGDSPPAVEVYNKRLYNYFASNNETEDSLLVYNEKNQPELIQGFKPSLDIYLKDYELAELDVYFVKKDKTMYSGKRIRGTLSNASFFDYIMIIDYKNQRFGLVKKEKDREDAKADEDAE